MLVRNKNTRTVKKLDSSGAELFINPEDDLLYYKDRNGATVQLTPDGDASAALPLSGGTMTGNLAMGGNKITGLAAGTTNGDSVRYEQVVGTYLPLAGGTVTGAIVANVADNILIKGSGTAGILVDDNGSDDIVISSDSDGYAEYYVWVDQTAIILQGPDNALTHSVIVQSGSTTIGYDTAQTITCATGGITIATGAGKVGFHGTTPVLQQSTTGTTTGFTAGAGTAVLDDSTFTGNLGATAYTIGDIVLAMKRYGLLAQ